MEWQRRGAQATCACCRLRPPQLELRRALGLKIISIELLHLCTFFCTEGLPLWALVVGPDHNRHGRRYDAETGKTIGGTSQDLATLLTVVLGLGGVGVLAYLGLSL